MTIEETLDKVLKTKNWKNILCFKHYVLRRKCENRCFDYIYCKECFEKYNKIGVK